MIELFHKRAMLLGVSAVALAILLSACGGYGNGTSQSGDAPVQTASGQPAAPSTVTIDGTAQIGTRSIPGIGPVLTSGEGLTLYRLTTDTSTTTTCTGDCARTWPPLLATNGSAPSSPSVGGKFGTLTRPDAGVQITFNGRPLYTYAGDSQPGEANGQGAGGVWFAVAS